MRSVSRVLVDRTLELCEQVCVTGHERPLADALESRYSDDSVVRVGDSLVIGRTPGESDDPVVLLVGHVDVVPPTDEEREPRLEGRAEVGQVVIGRGASDMKGGIAVAEVLYADRELRSRSPYELALVLYAGEEGPADANELADVLEDVPELADAAFAVVLEPTDLEVHAGCLGGLHAELTFVGRAAHSARPWHGDNPLTGAGRLLTELDDLAPVAVDVDGITYHDVLTATQAWTDNARNVVPGRFVVNVNYRFAPNRTLEAAEEELRSWVDGRAEVDITDRAPPAAPALDAAQVARFIERSGAQVAPKQAWTDIARLAAAGIPAVNYGPGLTSQAHQSGEYVPVDNLVQAHGVLRSFLLEEELEEDVVAPDAKG